MEAKKGRQTPTTAVCLPYKRSKGLEAIKLYNKTGRKAYPWQQQQLKDIMATEPGGLWVHTKYGLAVPRRNGKNEVIAARELWGIIQGERILHTAHRATTGHSAWERLCRLLKLAGYIENEDYKTYKALGSEQIIWLTNDGEINFRTRTAKGAIGEGYDLLVIDEAQEYTDDQESALLYVVSDSDNPQTLFTGTPPTPQSSGTVFTKFRKRTIDSPPGTAGWAEWSVDDMTDVYDRAAWYETNPSLGYKLTERNILDEIREDTTDFNIQRLGLWLKYNQQSAISKTAWEALQVDTLPPLYGGLFVGIKYGHDGNNVAMSIALRTDDRIFIEAIDCRPISAGTDWIISFLPRAKVESVIVDGANGQAILAEAMKAVKLPPPILPTVAEAIKAYASWELAINQGAICHKGQPALTQAVSNCTKRAIGTGGGFGYKALFEGVEIALMESAIFAYYGCENSKVRQKQRISY